jgi:hypothetical protein
MVDRRANSHEEENQRPKTKISKKYIDKVRGSRKTQYQDEKTKYQAAIKREKLNPGKNFATLHYLQIHGMQFRKLPQIKQKEAKL